MDEPEMPPRHRWYTSLLHCTPCTPEYAEMSSLLAQLSYPPAETSTG